MGGLYLGKWGNEVATAGKQVYGAMDRIYNPWGPNSWGGLLGKAGDRMTKALSQTNPEQAPLNEYVTPEQIQSSIGGAEGALTGQENLLRVLKRAGGIGGEAAGLRASQKFAGQMAGAGGIGNQSAAYGSQAGLANALSGAGGIQAQQSALAGLQNIAGQQGATGQMYQDIAAGRGPNPAMAALNQATGQNVANQAAMMAGQRGAGANVGLLARQAAQQGAGIQQQAVGQGAMMQSQQQLAALQGLVAQQQAQAATQGQIGGIGQGLVGQQQAAITGQAGIAQNQIQNTLGAQAAANAQANVIGGQQIGETNTITGSQQAQQNALLGAGGAYNQGLGVSQASVNAANAQTNAAKIGIQGGILGGAAAGIGAGTMMAVLAEGGIVESPQRMADGGTMAPAPALTPVQMAAIAPAQAAPLSPGLAPAITPVAPLMQEPVQAPMQAPVQAPSISQNQPQSSYGRFLTTRGDADSSAKKAFLMFSEGGQTNDDLKNGGTVEADTPSEKAVAAGNSYKNDTVPALLSENEIVLPRTVTQAKNAPAAAAAFVRKELAKK